MRSEYGNLILRLIRSRLATHVVYQSDFARGWWEHAYGAVSASHSVIHNGVDLRVYTPVGDGKPTLDRCRLLMVEGSLAGGYEQGLLVAVELAQRLGQSAAPFADQVELMAEFTLGIDFGTSTTGVALRQPGRPPVPLPIGRDGITTYMPSVVAFMQRPGGTAQTLVGEEADQAAGAAFIVRSVKRCLGCHGAACEASRRRSLGWCAGAGRCWS